MMLCAMLSEYNMSHFHIPSILIYYFFNSKCFIPSPATQTLWKQIQKPCTL